MFNYKLPVINIVMPCQSPINYRGCKLCIKGFKYKP